ncbi:hypothetical protein [Vibrio quintilis]|uniref:Uncharacterized protein n=1 Tax=Vibrio quintilis TaxID=1117707 RepID=A0A1M7YTB7_9VIBR|nr:hypothetical protein [Vibrio quintilis]SHO55786.1 hypothetical protein VQ7734_01532 [Vibrio quintilis]
MSISSCSADSVQGEVIPLESYHINQNVLTFKAQSNGCAQSNYFAIRTDEINGDHAVISVLQTTQDLCKRMPFFDTFSLPLDDQLLKKEVELANPKASPFVKKGK